MYGSLFNPSTATAQRQTEQYECGNENSRAGGAKYFFINEVSPNIDLKEQRRDIVQSSLRRDIGLLESIVTVRPLLPARDRQDWLIPMQKTY